MGEHKDRGVSEQSQARIDSIMRCLECKMPALLVK